ncbi:MAG: hypothetical protein PHW85_00460 [Bacteroidales bacterium]|nr:hypothetical protein [Bacteroidales bacterium]
MGLLSSCAKDYYRASGEDNKAYGSDGVFTLPVNLNRYNLLSTGRGTKTSSSDTTYYINVDSLINWHKCREMIFAGDGYVYTQVPFKSNEEGIYGLCAPTGAKNMKDSVARIKCFYILLENYKKGERYEYLVTMIPAKQMETQGRDYDFLSKPNFTGLVIYSSLKGEYIREEIYKNGIVYNGKLWSAEENKNAGKTKDDDDVVNGGTLKAAICTADKVSGNKELRDWMNANRGLTYNYVTKNTVTEEGKKPGGGGDGTQTPTPKMQYTIIVQNAGCNHEIQKQITVTKGDTIHITAAKSYGDTCLFFSWESSSGTCGTDPTYTINNVSSNVTLTARYASSGDCYKISQILNNETLRRAINILMGMSQDIEHGFYIQDGNVFFYNGGYDYVRSGNISGYIEAKFHDQTEGILFPSDKDFAMYCLMLRDHSNNWNSFVYGITNFSDLFTFSISNIELLRQFINSGPTDESEFLKFIKTDFDNKCGYDTVTTTLNNFNKLESYISKYGLSCYWTNGYTIDDYGNKLFYWQHYNGSTFVKMDCYSNSY